MKFKSQQGTHAKRIDQALKNKMKIGHKTFVDRFSPNFKSEERSLDENSEDSNEMMGVGDLEKVNGDLREQIATQVAVFE